MAGMIIDNGGYNLKVGTTSSNNARLIPNCVFKAKNVRSRVFIGDQIDDCKDLSGLYYLLSYQKGYLVNWDIQKQVWDYVFGKSRISTKSIDETDLLLTEPYFNFSSIQDIMNEIFFEDYSVPSLYRCNPAFLIQFKVAREQSSLNPCCLVVDSGYSFTHIIPYYQGKMIDGACRINVGGKILTNHLKEVVSYRQLMVMDETFVMNQMKEDVCFVSQDFYGDMNKTRKKGTENDIVRDYVLPDYTHIKRGYMRSHDQTTGKAQSDEQIIRMNNERFSIPEILFHPSDVGIQEMGIPEAIAYTVGKLPEDLQPHMFANIWLTGGSCMLPGFKNRVENDLRSMVTDEMEIVVNQAKNPISEAWEGGKSLMESDYYKKIRVTKQEYDEHGHSICHNKYYK